MPLSMLLSLPLFVLAGLGISLVVLTVAVWREMQEAGVGAGALRSGGERASSGLSSAITVGRAGAFGGFLVIETLIAEFLNIGWSILDITGPLVASNLFSIGFGVGALMGWIPVSPWWYAGVCLMVLGIAMSSAGEALLDHYSGAGA